MLMLYAYSLINKLPLSIPSRIIMKYSKNTKGRVVKAFNSIKDYPKDYSE